MTKSKESQAFDMARRSANRDLVATLTSLMQMYPDMRFGQLLESFGFVQLGTVQQDLNMYPELVWKRDIHLEPTALLERVREQLAKVNS